jgi:hypothetical protein
MRTKPFDDNRRIRCINKTGKNSAVERDTLSNVVKEYGAVDASMN